jgi:hypothetical protein
MTDEVDTETYTVEAPDGSTGDVTLPAGLVDVFSEPDDTPAEVFGDVALMAFVQRAHAVVHHSEGDPGEELQAIEAAALDLFEDRFGVTFAEATGHSH